MKYRVIAPWRMRGYECVAFLTVFLAANSALAQTVQGIATCRERTAPPLTAVVEAAPEEVTRADAPGETIARTRIAAPGNRRVAFTTPPWSDQGRDISESDRARREADTCARPES
jgi:uncharacterized lipoprotein YbaY